MKHILLCVAGMTPQIITETLWALTRKGERVDEIRVITTLDGRDRITTGGSGGPAESLLHPNEGRFFAFCRDFNIDPKTIKFDETTIALLRRPDALNLADIREPEENEFAGNQICDIVREMCRDPETRIHASAAGGRKTMSIFLTAAMQLFGRRQDKLSHVLVNEEFETNPDFYYPPPTPRVLFNKRLRREVSTADAKIYLADIPFIRLRGVLDNWVQHGGPKYVDYVHQAQDALNQIETANDLRINGARRTVTIAGTTIRLEPQKFFYYLLFAQVRKNSVGPSANGFVFLNDIKVDHLDSVAGYLANKTAEQLQFVAGFGFLEQLIIWVKLPYVDSEFQQTFFEVKAKIKKSIGKHLASEVVRDRFAIASEGEHGETRYGLGILPDHIHFE